jgi:hypothetical protein
MTVKRLLLLLFLLTLAGVLLGADGNRGEDGNKGGSRFKMIFGSD